MRIFIEGICAFIATAVANLLFVYWQQSSQYSDVVVLIFSATVGSGLWLVFYLFFVQGRRVFHPLRRVMDRRAEIEGYWFEFVDSSCGIGPYSILHFVYDGRKDQYNLHGWNFSSEGIIVREFYSEPVATQADSNTVHYYYTGHSFDSETNDRVSFKGVGYAKFSRHHKYIQKAKGIFLDKKSNTDPHEFLLEKITKKLSLRYAGKEQIENEDDLCEFVRSYHLLNNNIDSHNNAVLV